MTDHKELLMGLNAMADDGWKWPMQAAAAIREQAAQLKRLRKLAMAVTTAYVHTVQLPSLVALRKELEGK